MDRLDVSAMTKIFVIEDRDHAELLGEFATLGDAWTELRRLSAIPWDKQPNVAPCQSWQTCGRDYEIVEYETTSDPWILVKRYSGLEVSAGGVVWGSDAPQHGA